MRITGGRARGINLQSPQKGDTRPATDYLREAVFASLGPSVVGDARVLDCFAGTGAYALEAMSRGAASATLVEQNAGAVRCIRQNAQAVAKSAGFDAAVLDIQQADAVQWVRRMARALEESSGIAQDSPEAGQQVTALGATAATHRATAATSLPTLIFVDPPYAVWEKEPAPLLAALATLLLGAAAACPSARLVLEAPGNWAPPQLAGLTLVRHLKKGPHQPSALIFAAAE